MQSFKFKRIPEQRIGVAAKKYPPAIVVFVCALLASAFAHGQGADNLRSTAFEILDESVTVDTLSLVPGSEIVYINGQIADTSAYEIDHAAAKIIWKPPLPSGEAEIKYRVFTFNFSNVYMRRSTDLIQPDEEYRITPYTYRPQAEQESLFGSSQLNKTGSISRGVGFGNAQDLTVNSTLSLQLNGKINDRISVVASVTDDNIPIQPEGNTATLQEFDQVYIQLFDERSKLTAGDFFLSKPVGYFTNYYKRGQGATFSTRLPLGGDQDKVVFTETSAALSRGKFARNIIRGQEGNQGPYPLRGNENERFIIVLAGTERVFIDGREMQRGQENDYIIDYNTSEITFTANQLINKDKRIAVEFQYTDANYARSMVQTSTGIETEKFSFYVNFFSEQDAKNQPLQQDLTDNDRRILDAAGDNGSLALAPGFQQVAEFNNSQVLYHLKDTLGFDSVFVRAIADNGEPLFQVNFSEVGEGEGDYEQAGFDATGRVFRWLAPDTSGAEPVRRGNYAPIRRLVAPRKNQMLMVGGSVRLTERTRAMVEAGFSNQDSNTFSERDNENNVSHGFTAGITHEQPLSKKSDPLTLKGGLTLESIGENFQPIEPYRDVEFNRDWNLTNEMNSRSQNILTATLGLQKADALSIDYGINSFQAGNIYRGTKHSLSADADYDGLDVWFRGSLLETDGIEKSKFARHRSRVEKSIGIAKIGFEDEREENRQFRTESDSLSSTAYKFYDWQFYLTNADSSRLDYKIFYRERTDYATEFNNLGESTHASHYGVELGLMQNPRNQFKASFSNRVLNITNEELSNNAPERTLLARIEHSLRLAKNSIVTNTFYELGSGLERRQEFIFILDPTGQGPYRWIDYNGDGNKDLNEFELARPEDGERYIRVFTPTNDYIRAFSNQFSQSININPAAAWMGKEGVRGVIARFSNQAAFRISRRTQSEEGVDRFNPFASDISDTSLISQSSTIRNTVFYNRTSSKFGIDYTYSNQAGKNPFTGGFEEREQTVHTGRLRYNFTPEYGLVSEQEIGNRSSFSDIADGRNFDIDYYTAKQTLTYQPGTSFRLSFIGTYTLRNNEDDLGGESAELIDVGLDLRANKMESGSFFGHLNYISIEYDGATNNSVAYEMLDGLQNGGNITWGAGVQRQLGKSMQLSLSYNGRKSEEIDAVHTGNVQVRAFF